MKSLATLLDSLRAGQSLAKFCVRGDEPFIFSKIMEAYRGLGLEPKRFDVSRHGPDSAVEAEGLSMSLFGGGTLLWLETKKAPSSWEEDGRRLFEKLLSMADGQSLSLVLVLPADKRIKAPEGAGDVFSSEASPADRKLWLERMNKDRGGKLDSKRLSFLLHFDEPLMVLDNWVELWTLGGDLWANATLAWGNPKALEGKVALQGENPAFAWVDAVVDGASARALRLLDHLLEEGSDPLQLTALLSKSARLMASIVAKESLRDFPPFLVKKLQSKSNSKSLVLLKKCADLDLALKGTAQDARALLQTLC